MWHAILVLCRKQKTVCEKSQQIFAKRCKGENVVYGMWDVSVCADKTRDSGPLQRTKDDAGKSAEMLYQRALEINPEDAVGFFPHPCILPH